MRVFFCPYKRKMAVLLFPESSQGSSNCLLIRCVSVAAWFTAIWPPCHRKGIYYYDLQHYFYWEWSINVLMNIEI